MIHLLRHRIALGHEVEFISFLRHVGLIAAVEAPGIVGVYAGQRLAHQRKEHVAVTVWAGAEAAGLAIDAVTGTPRFMVPVARFLDEVESVVYAAELADLERDQSAKIIRLSRRAPVDADEARQMRERGIRRPGGCVGAWLGSAVAAVPAGPELTRELIAVSVWRGWEHLTSATGGRLTNPLPGLAEGPGGSPIRHYELIADGFGD